MSEITHTPTPWKAVSERKFFNGSALSYVSIQPAYRVLDKSHDHMKMADGAYHVCRMSHTHDETVLFKRIADADFIVTAVNAYDRLTSQNEWLKNRLSNLQLVANSPKNIEEWLVECGMPTDAKETSA